MKSASSNTIDLVLKAAYELRKSTTNISYDRAIEDKFLANSKPYKMSAVYRNLLKAESTVICDTDCYVFGSGEDTILYCHGGAYVDQPTLFHWRFLARLAKQSGCKIIAPIYGKAPQHNANEVVGNMCDIFLSIASKLPNNSVTIMGDSAGGGLSLAIAEMLLSVNSSIQPRQLILLSPWVDTTMSNKEIELYMHSDYMLIPEDLINCGLMYANGVEKKWLYCPIDNVTSGLAPITIFTGSAECLLPDCLKLKSICDQQGVQCTLYEFPHMQHVFVVQPLTEATEARNMILQLIKNT